MNAELAAGGVGLPVPPADGQVDHRETTLPTAKERLKSMVDEMILFRPSEGVGYAVFRNVGIDPKDALARIEEAGFFDLVLPNGAPLPNQVGEVASMLTDNRRLTGFSFIAKEIDFTKMSLVEGEVIEHSDQKDWSVSVELELWSQYENTLVKQVIAIDSDSMDSDSPSLLGEVLVNPDNEYGGYARLPDDGEDNELEDEEIKEERANKLLDLVSKFYDSWKDTNPERVEQVLGANARGEVSISTQK